VVSLARATDRRAFVSSWREEFGIDLEIIDAADGEHLSPDEARYSPLKSAYHVGRELTRGEVGCAVSHLRLYQRMVDERIEVAAVLEDDVKPRADVLALLDGLEQFPDEWDVITLMSLYRSAGPYPIGGGSFGGSQICAFRGRPTGTQGYVIRRRAAERLLRIGYPVRMPADELLYRRRPAGLSVFGVNPPLLEVGNFASLLWEPGTALQKTASWPLMQAARTMGRGSRALWRMVDKRGSASRSPGPVSA